MGEEKDGGQAPSWRRRATVAHETQTGRGYNERPLRMNALSEPWKPSVTVAAIVHEPREDRYLLVEEHTSDGIRLNNPAGHLDPGESLIEAAIRETLEETAYTFVPTGWLGAYMSRYASSRTHRDVTYLRFAFVGTVTAHDPTRTLDTGIIRAFWMTYDELRASTERHRSSLVLRCIEDQRAGRLLPLEALHADPSVYVDPDAGLHGARE